MSATTTKKRSGRKGIIVAAVLIVLVGAGFMLYPKLTDLRYSWAQWRLSAGGETIQLAPSGGSAGTGTGGSGNADGATVTGGIIATNGAGGITLPKSAAAQLVIPAIDFKAYVLEGTGHSVLGKGPGHYPATPLPGEPGNACIAGHRTMNGHPFGNLDRLQVGDEIYTATAERTSVYRVVKKMVVAPTDTWIADQDGPDRLTLSTCHPKGSAKQRLVIVAELIK